jgi:hypothetical protein
MERLWRHGSILRTSVNLSADNYAFPDATPKLLEWFGSVLIFDWHAPCSVWRHQRFH